MKCPGTPCVSPTWLRNGQPVPFHLFWIWFCRVFFGGWDGKWWTVRRVGEWWGCLKITFQLLLRVSFAKSSTMQEGFFFPSSNSKDPCKLQRGSVDKQLDTSLRSAAWMNSATNLYSSTSDKVLYTVLGITLLFLALRLGCLLKTWDLSHALFRDQKTFGFSL